MLVLRTFGGLSLAVDGAPGSGAAQQRKTLALLALLAAAGRRGLSRDKVSAYLWPESDVEHARNLLKQACYTLRRDLHAPELFLGAVELRLNPDVITSDIGTLEDALARGDPAGAVAVYGGPFLDGFYLADAAEFERWVEQTRAALKTRVCETLESLATQTASAGDVHESVKWWRRLAALDPLDARPALGLLRALIAAGERTAALEFGRVHENLVRQELGVAPDPAVSELLKQLRSQAKRETSAGVAIAEVSAEAASAPPIARQIGTRLAIGAAVLALVGTLVVAYERKPASFDPDLLAVAPFDVFDPKLGLWHEGLVDVLSRNLDGAGAFRTVSPTVVIRRWRGRADRGSAQGLGRQTGAGVVVFGQLLRAGPDSVRLSAAVLDTRKGRTLAEIDRTDHADRIDRLADSLSLDVIRTLTSSTPGLHIRLFSVGTRSLPALKAFLQGERFLRRFALDSAIASYDRAVAMDTAFALSLRRLQLALGWNDSAGPVDYFVRAAALNHGLSVRDSLLVLSDSGFAGPASLPNNPAFRSAVQRRVAILEEAARRYPGDPEVWYHLGEVRFHSGFVVGNSWNDARAAFDRAITLDSGFAPAYVHPVEIALNDNDPHAALRYVRGYLAISSVIPGGAAMRLLAEVLDPQGARPRDVARELDTASPAALHLLALAVQSWPDADETQLQVWPRVVATRRGRLSPGSTSFYPWLPVYLSMVPRVLIHRGHLREARAIVGNQFGVPFMELAELGVIPRETVETALSQWFHHPSAEDLSLYPRVAAGPCHRTLDAALWWAGQKDTASLQRLVRREASPARTVNPFAPTNARPVPELAGAALALARGDTTSALSRFLAFPDSLCPDAERLREVRFRLLAAVGRRTEAAAVFDRSHDRWVPLMLERARVAERLGDPTTAGHYYQFVLQAWQHADPELKPVVAEARAALTRLGEAWRQPRLY